MSKRLRERAHNQRQILKITLSSTDGMRNTNPTMNKAFNIERRQLQPYSFISTNLVKNLSVWSWFGLRGEGQLLNIRQFERQMQKCCQLRLVMLGAFIIWKSANDTNQVDFISQHFFSFSLVTSATIIEKIYYTAGRYCNINK